ncbi:MAG: hypothetical protein ACM33V_01625 [Chloroflexota bacterium]|nr:hypothetical protein [Anaerolineales bacterium]
MTEAIKISDRVEIFLDANVWGSEGWFEGTVVRIDPYSRHRSFYWIELSEEAIVRLGKSARFISVLNPKNIRKV